ncbi:MAG: hypothetical protein K6G07_07540 [Lachnospiraceae bacterium]|nr:hypothetical protein [Lachnospiraceae bacterium]
MDGNGMNNNYDQPQDPVLTGYDQPVEPAVPTEPVAPAEPVAPVNTYEQPVNMYEQPTAPMNGYEQPMGNGYEQPAAPMNGYEQPMGNGYEQPGNTYGAPQSTVGQSFEYNNGQQVNGYSGPQGTDYSNPAGGSFGTPNYSDPNGAPLTGQVYGTGTSSQQQQSDGKATASLILGICSILFCCCYGILGMGLGIGGLVLASSSAKENNGEYSGSARAGQVTSIIGIVLGALYLIFTIIMIASGAYADMLGDL